MLLLLLLNVVGVKVVVQETVSVSLEEMVSVSAEVVLTYSVRDVVGVVDEFRQNN